MKGLRTYDEWKLDTPPEYDNDGTENDTDEDPPRREDYRDYEPDEDR